MLCQQPAYLIIVGVKSEGIPKMLERFLVLPELDRENRILLVLFVLKVQIKSQKRLQATSPTSKKRRPRVVRSSVFSGENLHGERSTLNDKCHIMLVITFNAWASLSREAADYAIRLYFSLIVAC